MDKENFIMVKPIFIFSLPRSGSTLLQKILVTNKNISSVAEPWLLLPFVHIIKEKGILAKYSHKICYNAFQDFISNIGGKQVYFNELRKFTLNLYKNASKNYVSKYFLDKTPRYYLIINEIAEIFPNAKFIFLFRNPLDIYSSIITTWHKNRLLTLHGHNIDLFEGPKYLLNGFNKLSSRSLKINYEELVSNPEKKLLKLSEYLELEYQNFNLSKYNMTELNGRMGDKIGIRNYKSISKRSINKWQNSINSYFRKKYAQNYIENLNENYLALTNNKKSDLIKKIKKIKVNRIGVRDYIDFRISNVYRVVKLKFQIQNHFQLLKSIDKNESLYL